ncbi:tRNA lysidine(34) synthetase TilS [Pelagivirga sediminicola]|uniref:tRNA(Ile)-lysidine synthase n=1 Tax=Pelagivirga sediminicola TaxID=2170575 RepID=A0A2T7G768_9RHOB|nr:tRNA lysidine(34) synthetase TilS [Pelagivirga sediminicola]PVA10268.1 tRNA lysidine(34) synthetase TilS [Pelagivirga sediminicola]
MTVLPALISQHFQTDRGPLGVAVSGGSDSLALLHLMADWGGAPLRCVTVDHRLRAASGPEAAQVAAICASLGIAHDTLTWDGWDGRGNLAATARAARYALMAAWAHEHGLSGVALGHTRDDVAETLLMRLARRAGVDGLAAMPARRREGGVTLHRPLLAAGRGELRAYLEARGATWIDDPSNSDGRYRRTLARRALTALEPVGISAQALADVAAHMAEARGTLGHYAAQEARALVAVQHGDLLMPADAFARLRPDIARRILSAGLRWITGAGYGARGPDLDRLLAAIASGRGGTLGGCHVSLSGNTLRVAREFAAVRHCTAAPGTPWDGRWDLNGPHLPDAELRALGAEGRAACPAWRETGLPAQSVQTLPAVWQGDTLIAAPLAGDANGWTARLRRDATDLQAMLLSH